MKLSLFPLIFPLLACVSGLPTASTIAGTAIESRQNSVAINVLLAFISKLFPVNILVNNVGDLIEGAEKVFADIAGFDTNENDLLSGKCGDVVIVYARGTTEPGNVGSLTGPPFFTAVRNRLSANGKTLAVQGVDDYEADVTGFLEGGDAKGSQRMSVLVTQAFKQCPSSKIVMSGYSQGSQVVHNAAKLLPASTMSAVSSIVMFGDPLNGSAVQGGNSEKVLSVCHAGDNICDHGDFILLPHLTYLIDADKAADFVIAHI
ncbi:putative Cutinase [Seiridium cardinale]